MSEKQKQHDTRFSLITAPLGEQLTWRWDDKQNALLTEFSWEKKDPILAILRQLFSDEWHKKNIKKMPKAVKGELADLLTLSKTQLVFTRPASENMPTIAAFWWPWGHGGTYSLRVKLLNSTYSQDELTHCQASFFKKLFQRTS